MDGLMPNPDYSAITVTPCSPHIGAEIGDIDLTRPLSNSEAQELKQAFTQYLVLFFRDQELSPEQHKAFARRFGEFQPFLSYLDMLFNTGLDRQLVAAGGRLDDAS